MELPTGLSDLPPELRCRLIQENPLSLPEVASLAAASRGLNQDIYICLIHLQPSNDNSTTILPNNLTAFPNLVTCGYSVMITSLQDLIRIAQMPRLKQVTLNLIDYDPQRNDDLTIAYSIGGRQHRLNRLGLAIAYFYALYLDNHPYHDGIQLTFLSSFFQLNLTPSSFCLQCSAISTKDWGGSQLVSLINYYSPIRKYTGPDSSYRESKIWEYLPFVEEVTLSLTEESPFFQDILFLPRLLRLPQLRHFGIHINPPYDPILLRADLENILTSLIIQNLSFPHLTSLDLPVELNNLKSFIWLFPNVRKPLLISPITRSFPLEDTVRIKQHLTALRTISPEGVGIISALTGIATYYDPDNDFSFFQC